MARITPKEKREIKAKITAFPKSGFDSNLSPSLCKVYGSFFGRDYKLFAQMCLYLLWEYLTQEEKMVWLSLSKVGLINIK